MVVSCVFPLQGSCVSGKQANNRALQLEKLILSSPSWCTAAETGSWKAWPPVHLYHSLVGLGQVTYILASALLSLKRSWALTGVSQWVRCHPVNRKVDGLIPGLGTSPGCGPGPRLGMYERPLINGSLTHDVPLPHFLPPFPSH